MAEFLYMGGYAVFVWGSYVAAVILLVAMYVQPHWKRRSLRGYFRQKFRMTERSPGR